MTAFCFSAYKNYNLEAIILIVGVPVVGFFLSNTSLTIFAFSITNIGIVAGGILDELFILFIFFCL